MEGVVIKIGFFIFICCGDNLEVFDFGNEICFDVYCFYRIVRD